MDELSTTTLELSDAEGTYRIALTIPPTGIEECIDLLVYPLLCAAGYAQDDIDQRIATEGMVITDPADPCPDCLRYEEALRTLRDLIKDDALLVASISNVLAGGEMTHVDPLEAD